jgi:hypothetical protein
MVKNKLISLGCSLTNWHGLKEKAASLANLDLVNLSYGAGSNILQVNRLHEYIINNELNNDDIVLWQITGDGRNGLRLQANAHNVEKVKHIQTTQFEFPRHHYIDTSVNIFDGQSRIDLLCGSPILDEPDVVELFDANQQTQTLLATIILLHKMHPKTLIFFGWDDILDNNNKEIFLSFLNKHSITHLEQSYVNWVKENNGKFVDGSHPTIESGEMFAEHIIIKKFKELNWI